MHHPVVVAGRQRVAGQQEPQLDRVLVAAGVPLDEHAEVGLREVADLPGQRVGVVGHRGQLAVGRLALVRVEVDLELVLDELGGRVGHRCAPSGSPRATGCR